MSIQDRLAAVGIRFNPELDSTVDRNRGASGLVAGATTVSARSHLVPAPATVAAPFGQYISPHSVPMGLEDRPGRLTQADVLPALPEARDMVVVTPSRQITSGVSTGFNPHKLARRVITVDPNFPGESFEMDLDAMTQERAAAAFREADEIVAELASTGQVAMAEVDMTRLRGSITAKLIAQPAAPSAAAPTLPGLPARPAAAPQAPPQSGTAVPNSPWLAAAPPVIHEVAPPVLVPAAAAPGALLEAFARPAAAPAAAPAPSVAEPTIRVVFDIPNAGRLEAHYHEVVFSASGNALALVYRNGYRGHRYLPCQGVRTADGSPPMVVAQIEGQPALYQLLVPDVLLQGPDRSEYLLFIAGTRPLEAAPGGGA